MSGEVGELVTIVGAVKEVDGDRRLVEFDRGGEVVSQWFLADEVVAMGFDDEDEDSSGN